MSDTEACPYSDTHHRWVYDSEAGEWTCLECIEESQRLDEAGL